MNSTDNFAYYFGHRDWLELIQPFKALCPQTNSIRAVQGFAPLCADNTFFLPLEEREVSLRVSKRPLTRTAQWTHSYLFKVTALFSEIQEDLATQVISNFKNIILYDIDENS